MLTVEIWTDGRLNATQLYVSSTMLAIDLGLYPAVSYESYTIWFEGE